MAKDIAHHVHLIGSLLEMWSLQWRHNERDGVSIVYSTVCSDADQRNAKAPRHWPLWGEFTGDQWIPRTNGPRSNVISEHRLRIKFISTSCKIDVRWIRHKYLWWWVKASIVSGNGFVPSGNEPLLEPSWSRYLSPYGVTRLQWVKWC